MKPPDPKAFLKLNNSSRLGFSVPVQDQSTS